MNSRTILVWFRNDLRTHDNEVLTRALEQGNQIVPVYCFDPRHFEITNDGMRKTGVLRAEFIRRNVQALRDTFRQAGGDLYIAQGIPADILPELCRTLKVDEVYHHREVAFEETEVSARVEAALWKQQINLRHFIGHTLYHKEDLPFPIKDIPDSFSLFRKKTERESSVRPGFEKPAQYHFVPGLPESRLPELSELGYTEQEITQAGSLDPEGGELVALEKLARFLTTPESFTNGSGVSPYVAVGALSPNTYYHKLLGANQESPRNKLIEDQIQQLLWRDYYRFMFKKHGNLFFQRGGVTGQIPEISITASAGFDRWRNAETGVELIDKSMKQLHEKGLISTEQRLITATYLVHELGADWLKGAAWFEEKLLDYNPCSNYGNWAHVAGVGSSTRDNKPLNLNKVLKTQ